MQFTHTLHPRSFFFILLVCSCLIVGCGDRVTVSGRITFPDGEPLTEGSVVFESENYQAYSYIGADGSYSLGEVEPGDGIRPGEYKIRILASTGGGSDGAPLVNLVDSKYESTATSGLTCTVKGKMTFGISVTKPGQ